MNQEQIDAYQAALADDERRPYKIKVAQFERGNSGTLNDLGFIWRHAAIEKHMVPVASGCASPTLRERYAIQFPAAGKQRFLYPEPDAEGNVTFELVLTSGDRKPSGLQVECECCKGKGYVLYEDSK